MSTEEETELRDLVAQTLELNGCLSKIRVQKLEPLRNSKIKTQLESKEGRIMFCLVREFLEYFNLDFTISVYEPESYLGTGYHYDGRSKIIDELGIAQLDNNSMVPLLLQLIQLAQANGTKQSKNIDINLSKIHNESPEKEEQNQEKTDVSGVGEKSSITTISDVLDHNLNISDNNSSSSSDASSNHNSINGILNPVMEINPKNENLNATFDISNPSIKIKECQSMQQNEEKPMQMPFNPYLLNSAKTGKEDKDDTYEGTSSITEDSIKDSPSELEEKGIQNDIEFSPPVLKDTKTHSKFDSSLDKLKLSPQKTEKLKAKSSLSSLADLPPLQLNKSRNDTVLLPSLYSKEFKEKANNHNLKELERYFDVDPLDNYEEDFMSESEINLNLDSSKSKFLEDLQSSSMTDSIKSGGSKTSIRNWLSQSAQKCGKNKGDSSSLNNSSSNGVNVTDNTDASVKTHLNADDI